MSTRQQLKRRIDSFMAKEVLKIAASVPSSLHLIAERQELNDAYYLRHRIETVKRIRLTSRTDALALAKMVDDGEITPAMAKQVFGIMLDTGSDATQIVREQGLAPIRDAHELQPFIDKVIAANRQKAEQYRSGKSGLLGFFVGQVMRATGGRANPQAVNDILKKRLAG